MRRNLVLAVALGIAGCGSTGVHALPEIEQRTVTIVAMNDFHGALYEVRDRKQTGQARG